MKIEKEKLQFTAFTLTPVEGGGGFITIANREGRFQLSPLQYSYLDVLKNGQSIEEMVQFFLGQGWLVSFRELYSLILFLVKEQIVTSPSVLDYFKRALSNEAPLVFTSMSSLKGFKVIADPSSLPFFRSLEPNLAKHLLKDAERIKVPPHFRVTHVGQRDRDLFILMQGHAAIYKVMGANQRQMVATLDPGAIFGERAFLLNQPRSADVITTVASEVLRVRYRPEYEFLIKTDKAQSLQQRFWVMQALMSSPLFKELPSDTLDALIFAGRLVQAPANQVLFQEGQSGNTCYVLVQGSAVVSQNGQNINVLNQGACFGEISLLLSGGQRTASVTTQRECILMEIPQNVFYRVLSQNLILAKEIETLAHTRLQKDQARKSV